MCLFCLIFLPNLSYLPELPNLLDSAKIKNPSNILKCQFKTLSQIWETSITQYLDNFSSV